MSLIVSLSKRVATVIHESNPEETSSAERLTALLAIQVVNFGVIFAALAIGAITGEFWGTALAVATFAVIRALTGGFHFKNLDICFMASTITLVAIPHINIYSVAISIISGVMIILLSKKKRAVPILIVGTNLFVGSPIIALAALAQSLTLIERR